jgi:NAD(P)-dependent dehydrogenase (short-subunit alcohol dehydrogenase family)
MSRIEGKICLVTGAARGLGAATARRLAEAGGKVVLTDLNEAGGEETATAIREAGGDAMFIRQDVTDEAEWPTVVDAAVKRFGGLDVLVNNAGIWMSAPIEQMTLADWRHITAINLDSVFLGTRAAIGAIKARAHLWKGGGSIVNISSVAGLRGAAFASSYNATKGGVRLFTKAAALEFARLGYKVRVNSVHPAVIQTNMADALIQDFSAIGGQSSNELRGSLMQQHPMGSFGNPVDVANGVLYLASCDSAFSTGTELVIDGGMTA